MIKIKLEKWLDPKGKDDTQYSGWGYKMYIGQIYIGWLIAYESGKFEIACESLRGDQKFYSLEECVHKIEILANSK